MVVVNLGGDARTYSSVDGGDAPGTGKAQSTLNSISEPKFKMLDI